MYESPESSVSLTAAVVNLGTEFVMRGSALGTFSLKLQMTSALCKHQYHTGDLNNLYLWDMVL